MTVNSRSKGKRGEIDARNVVRVAWHAHGCIRSAQAAGAFAADLLHVGKAVHVEVKNVAKIGVEKFMAQAERDAAEGELPIVVMRQTRGEWTVMFRLTDSDKFATMLQENKARE